MKDSRFVSISFYEIIKDASYSISIQLHAYALEHLHENCLSFDDTQQTSNLYAFQLQKSIIFL